MHLSLFATLPFLDTRVVCENKLASYNSFLSCHGIMQLLLCCFLLRKIYWCLLLVSNCEGCGLIPICNAFCKTQFITIYNFSLLLLTPLSVLINVPLQFPCCHIVSTWQYKSLHGLLPHPFVIIKYTENWLHVIAFTANLYWCSYQILYYVFVV